MARPMSKEELIQFSEDEYSNLLAFIAQLTDKQRDSEYIFDNRTTKDIVAHIYAWQLLELTWYTEGMKGHKVEIPAPGYNFKDSPALNEKLYQEHKSVDWEALEKSFKQTHSKLIEIVNKHTEEELFTKKKYTWTGSSNMSVYLRSALSSHYMWGFSLIKKHFRNKLV